MNGNKQTAGRITIHYAAAFAVYFAAFCMIRSFISVYLLDVGFTYTQVGIITGIHMFFTAAIQPNFSLIFDRFPKLGLRRFIALCCVPAVLSSVLTFFLPANLFTYVMLYIVFAVCEIGVQSLMVSMGMEYVNAGIPINAGLGRGVGSLGYAAANLILGMLIVRFGSPVSQRLNILLMILFAVLVLTMPDPAASDAEKKEEMDDAPSDTLLSFLRGNRVFALFAFSELFIFFSHCILNTYMPNIAAQFGLGSDFTGLANSLAACLELIPMMFFAQISKRIRPMKLLYISAVFFTLKILTAALARNAAGLILSQTMQMCAYALFSVASIYFANQAVRPHNRVMAQGLLVGACEAGFMIGSLVGGVILDHSSVSSLLRLGCGISLVGSILMIVSVRKFEKQTD